MDSVILLVCTETAGSDCSGIVSGGFGIWIGMVGLEVFITHSFDTNVNRVQSVIKIDGVGFES